MQQAPAIPFCQPGRPPRRTRGVPTARAGAAASLAASVAGAVLALGLATAQAVEPAAAPGGIIGFDVSALDAAGLIGPPDGKRSVDYEFCIPAAEGFAAEVQAIDATARLQPGSPGRIGCGPGQVLVLGNTHQPHFARVLQRLAELPYVERIERAWFE
jgi:hypothetical protein